MYVFREAKHAPEQPNITINKESYRIGDWTATPEVRDRGSVFIGRAITASSLEEVEGLVGDLLCDETIARATHNMAAWRIRVKDEGGVTQFLEDFNEDGEPGSAACMLHTMQIKDAQNVVVVISRYFGGTLLGAARFRHIKGITHDALVEGRFITGK